ncbi:MAG: methionyl-tRNA formyltransferase [Coriobacteriia bacterium]|nr:methionyl-tRNA formyltransferase [Coriobacteriia bacterium]
MRVVFMGTPQLAATVLEELAGHHQVVGVYTRPDAVRGRGKELVASPVKACAQRLLPDVPVRTPKTLRDAQVQQELRDLNADVFVVAAYGMLLPVEVLDIPPLGCLNVHASLLPRWRGAAPIERAILAGDHELGVCIMRMEEGLDTGDYCVCRSVYAADRSAADLTDELANRGAQALLTALTHVEAGAAQWVAQDESQVTYAQKIQKGELNVLPQDDLVMAARKVRASSEGHPCRVTLAGKGVTLLRCAPCAADDPAVLATAEQHGPVDAGALRFAHKRLLLGVADGVLEVLECKPDGKKAMAAKDFAAGLQGVKKGTLRWEALNG